MLQVMTCAHKLHRISKNIKVQVILLPTEIKSSGYETAANVDFLSNKLVPICVRLAKT